MKRCPECKRVYDDETLNFCLDDGAPLGFRSSDDEATTAVLPNSPSEGSTAVNNPARHSGRDSNSSQAPNRNLAIALFGLILSAALGTAIYYYFDGRRSKQIDSIAVLPFVNASGNAEIEYLSDGITESLIGSLSRIPDLTVKSRSAVFRFKNSDADARAIGRDLGVQALLSGRLVQRGQDLTLFIELIDAATDNSRWQRTYNRPRALSFWRSSVSLSISGTVGAIRSRTDLSRRSLCCRSSPY